MSQSHPQVGDKAVLPAAALSTLLDLLVQDGFQPIGPTIQDGHLVLDSLSSVADLPQGWTTEADAGTFKLSRRTDPAYFGYNLGQESWKKFLFPSQLALFRAQRQESGLMFQPIPDTAPPYALIGVRACELAALEVHDRTLRQGPYVDPVYDARRQAHFIVAVNCTESDAACFCASLGTGPGAEAGFDLALTEIINADGHQFLVQAGSPKGETMLARLPGQPVTTAHQEEARGLIQAAARSQTRAMKTDDLPGILYSRYDHPQWDDVAARCLSCSNCALVCPTCFCHAIADQTDLEGEEAERWRVWDVCHMLDHSYIHGGWLRTSTRSRYRQWLTHKLATWIDQFGCLGCIGCGRCLVWCPVAIDITAELRAIRGTTKQE
jgi:formate hydrogenlyase subunit 6/NADH:ubiquinone oxidoreductase subunit I